MPGQTMRRRAQRPNHLPRPSRKARRSSYIAVGGDFAFRNPVDGLADDLQHVWNLLSAVPSQCPPQPLLERILRIMAQVASRGSGVGLGVSHVAFARGAVICGQRDALDSLEQAPNVIQRVTLAVSGVIHLAGYTVRFGRLPAQRR